MDRLTRRQALGGAVAAVLIAAATVAGIVDRPGLALAALAPLAGLLLLGLLQVRRRVAEVATHTISLGRQAESWRAQADQTLLAARERDRGAAENRQQALLRAIEGHQQTTSAGLRQFAKQLTWQQREQTRQVEALLQLFAGFMPRAPMPSSGHWALNPTDLLELWATVDRLRPRLVLELGSGASSVWLGYALERCGGRLVSLEHDLAYAEQSRTMLARHGLAATVEVRDAPLTPVPVGQESFHWYDSSTLKGLAGVDLLLVDGPPGATGPQARFPALPLLADRLSPAATVLLDDADRDDEQEIIRRWTALVPGLTREPGTLGHLAVLRYPGPE